ncbi:urea ABC transporter permease subunit UrtC [Phormidium yuhuli AB48]|uniref:Urea ABC transporter permease subunit UrtC n=1 Tax=Phormidium yuhuli AB48 TaxID=2940671 RepID=A0ABY5ALC1_9CYAN|nr:urea ABC transporter permease subunit UrtC [Phormidium yuhuli]USR89620.1 urea ABC transporter permease subunit UrtC [Phormidium yuhuli AB48]
MSSSPTHPPGTKSRRPKWWLEPAIVLGVAIALAVIMPLILPVFRLRLLGRFVALAIAALGIDLIWGYTGLLSLGHGIFFALGGYAFAMHLNLQLPEGQIPNFFSLYGVEELPWIWQPFYSLPVTLISIVLIPGLVAGLLGYLVFRNRIKGVYFSILTQAALLVFFNFFNGQQDLINGTNGLSTNRYEIFGVAAGAPQAQLAFFQTSLVMVGLVYLLCRWLTDGRFGRMLVAIRDDEIRARFAGYDPTGFKILVFAVSGAIAGISGALFTVQTGLITPSFMEVAFSIEMVIWVAVGGRASLIGAIIGTILVRTAQTFLSEWSPEAWLFFQGGLFLIVVTVLPNGLYGWFRDSAIPQVRSRLGLQPRLVSYPDIDLNPEVQQEQDELERLDR